MRKLTTESVQKKRFPFLDYPVAMVQKAHHRMCGEHVLSCPRRRIHEIPLIALPTHFIIVRTRTSLEACLGRASRIRN